MFVALLAFLLIAWAVHLLRSGPRTRERGGMLLLLYVLVGYCGIPMLLVAGVMLVHPHEMAHMLGVEPDHRQLMTSEVGHAPPGGRVRRDRAVQVGLAV